MGGIKVKATEGCRNRVDVEYITVAQAARLVGYRDPRTLQRAASAGRLRTTTVPPFSMRVTTRAWLEEYLGSIQHSKSHRGRPRSGEGSPAG